MKKILYTLLAIAAVLTACNNDKKQEKDLQKQVIDFHEKVMADDEKAMVSKLKLDTVMMQARLAKADTAEAHKLSAALMAADDDMGNWMQKFEPDFSGKGHDDVMKYLTEQQTKVKAVDEQLIEATKQAQTYLQTVKKK
ncbi:hypothetical protein BEL04_02460 [Mucilaginibacter sp. PPCGB 2223]|uniref:hypothetical protein n=1 Tax=Mucilaginibacter sp. PPCGB 2223 TaxID=1886027 RepID=UPI000823FD06|nr:hypothetical protein [Mucilaginibacter sp. PPCGB 2223]OCX53193.1 hypothetical protein BEL04_02460 [Mucilaginibacter sp. PPCGB 2223]